MKLIRITSEDDNGYFDAYFNEDIIVEPNSKIALQNVSMECIVKTLEIGAGNDRVRFNLRSGAVGSVDKYFDLTHTSTFIGEQNYNSNNYKLLFKEIQDKMNALLSGQGKEIGVQIKADIDTNGKFYINCLQSDFNNRNAQLIANIPTKTLGGVPNSPVVQVSVGANQTWDTYTTKTASASLESYNVLEHSLTKGCGVYQAQIRKLTNNATADHTGFLFGVSSVPPSTWAGRDPLITDIEYGIEVQSIDLVPNYININQGNRTNSGQPVGYVGNNNGNNDYVCIHIASGLLTARIYNNGGGAVPVDLFSIPYDNNTPYYPIYIIRGAFQDVRLNKFRFTTDPYYDPPTLTGHQPITDLGTPQPPVGTGLATPSNAFVEFQGITLAQFLGYEFTRQPLNGFQLARSPIFTADNNFSFTNVGDAFLVEMLNLPLLSYDSYDVDRKKRGGRKNLLSVIPKSNSDGEVIYEPNTINFIDIDNVNALNLRNIKCRIVNNDYSPPSTRGLMTLTMLIKNKNE